MRVGDYVRVKAGVKDHHQTGATATNPRPESIGKILEVDEVCDRFVWVRRDYQLDSIYPGYLEPWVEGEKWDGSKWVPEKPATTPKKCVVATRGSGICSHYPSTNAAVRAAEMMAAAQPGTEFVVYQEKASFKVEKPEHPAYAAARAINEGDHRGVKTTVGKHTFFIENQTAEFDGEYMTVRMKVAR